MKILVNLLLVVSSVIFMSFTFNLNFTFVQDKWVAPESSKELKNPFAGNESIAKGETIYKTRCLICHGVSGTGDGPAGKALNPPATDVTADYLQNQTDGELFWKVSEGRGAMVGWKLILSEEERWALINYMRTL